jgi:hypothetical protein
MSFSFLPAGSPRSNLHAISASYAATVDVGAIPATSSYAEYSLGNIGPAGANTSTVNGSIAIL